MHNAIYSETIGKYRVNIFPDEWPICPVTDCDILGTFTRYYEGKRHVAETNHKNPASLLQAEFEHCKDNKMSVVFGFSVGRYERLNWKEINWWDITEDTADDFDGIYYISSSEVKKEYGHKKKAIKNEKNGKTEWFTPRQMAIRGMVSLLENMRDYYEGNVYGYVIADTETGEESDSCWGFFGDFDGDVLEEAKRIVQWNIERDKKTDVFVKDHYHV